MENSPLNMNMKGGEGPSSYFRNSTIQAEVANRAKDLLRNGIQESLEVPKDSKIFSIADLGCSVGPNTFSSVSNIIEAVEEKLGIQSNNMEFQVFFNDIAHNDFNTLFTSLPSDRKYFASGVPGFFQNRLFPRSSINLIHSACALNWLTKIPQEITEEGSPLWNKGRITYALSSDQIGLAFRDQFLKDIKDFFKARTDELIPGGLLMIILPCREEGTNPSQSETIQIIECLGEVITDMVNEGLIAESLLNSFNIPLFFPEATELGQALLGVKHLKAERYGQVFLKPKLSSPEDIQLSKMHVRATLEDMLCKHFGPDLIDEMFDRYPEKLEKLSKSTRFTQERKIDRNVFLLAKCDYDS